ncbi:MULTISPECIES: PQQ-dependent sugar dehydrogenase [Rhodobacterales]|jgi:glucose/arabinose dehydrogenase|uniref:PQQ-dependent sugar dehydrogenase n=1 Tax=Rhodobacterales TaxID=204455 RepID=UPI00237F5C8A|nr:PQQ-dependent sugar dehydrogenase [Phaeobacter gallaeciensis]MDE4139775.1 PQQ-dependent sugar dehydrogenase [Phaeobacter gallaeciensis]MDE4148615.1 PQQ-dependent sugar dehydrogenase [Phaeobacter gallaeciensis]MDE4152438.1 PQQ-dependent sugar dehydrogenase [Phaeobacter gallaeciensis]MDE4228226.1 PQQ-dependent sugar dehydrogenase [Phaeobacter gallaeciensis]MDE4256902.1 PQQ-dependent sugar dehydrogenase [Phaeobacter gallaeciensis]
MKQVFGSAALCLTLAASASAQSAPGEPGTIRITGSAEHTYIDQDTASADALRRVLEGIRLPTGFRIELYAMVPGARHMALSPGGTVLFVGTRRDKVWAVLDRDRDGAVDEVKDFAPSLSLDISNGVEVSPDGDLFIAERNRVLRIAGAEAFDQNADMVAVPIVPQGSLIREAEESSYHTARVIKLGPDNKLYISLGQPFNVAPPEKLALYNETGIGGIIRMNRDGSGREVFTYGARNSVGHDFHPETGELWWTDNQVDGMGDDIPPGEINRQTEKGQHFGFPWYGGGSTRTREYAGQEVPVEVVMPAVETIAHAADLGMSFYTGDMFPEKYRNAIFSAQHGSWNRSERVGARVMVTFIDAQGNAAIEPFAEGWLNQDGEYDGRPVDVIQHPDGSILVSDDFAGAVYRISYSP